MEKVEALPALKTLPAGVARLVLGSAKWQAEMLRNFAIAVVSGIFLVLAVLILLYRKIIPPFVNMGSLLLAPLGGAIALLLTGHPLSDRKSVVSGKSWSVRVDLGGRRLLK